MGGENEAKTTDMSHHRSRDHDEEEASSSGDEEDEEDGELSNIVEDSDEEGMFVNI